MILRSVVVVACLAAALPVKAGELKAEEARRLVVGKLFSFNCFDGTTGAGRVFADGSVVGIVRFQGSSTFRYVALPANTLQVRGETVCASVRGMPLQPCFTLNQIDDRTFRGSISGLSFASCQFTRRGGRNELVHTSAVPPATQKRSVRSSTVIGQDE